MILRTGPDGEVLLMRQTDHSQFAGLLAAHWGNDTYARPQPYESVVRGATFHDFGWLRFETSPRLNPDTGQPYTFLNLPFSQQQLDAYQWCADWLTDIDRYSGLLVGMHRVGLWKSRYDTITYPAWRYAGQKHRPEIEEFIRRNEAIHEHERAAIGGDTIWTSYRLLQVWDLLGLYFCCGEPYEHAVEPVPTAYDGDLHSGVRMHVTPLSTRRVQFDPYPFDVRPLLVRIPYRRMSRATFPDEETFQKEYFQANVEFLEYEIL